MSYTADEPAMSCNSAHVPSQAVRSCAEVLCCASKFSVGCDLKPASCDPRLGPPWSSRKRLACSCVVGVC